MRRSGNGARGGRWGRRPERRRERRQGEPNVEATVRVQHGCTFPSRNHLGTRVRAPARAGLRALNLAERLRNQEIARPATDLRGRPVELDEPPATPAIEGDKS